MSAEIYFNTQKDLLKMEEIIYSLYDSMLENGKSKNTSEFKMARKLMQMALTVIPDALNCMDQERVISRI